MSDTDKAVQQGDQASTAVAEAKGASVDFKKIGMCAVAAVVIGLLLEFSNLLLNWGAIRAIKGAIMGGFSNTFMYDIQFFFSFIILFLCSIATAVLVLVTSSRPGSSGSSWLVMVPHYVNTFFVLLLVLMGGYLCISTFRVGGFIFWTGVNNTIMSLFMFLFALISILLYVAAIVMGIYFAVKGKPKA